MKKSLSIAFRKKKLKIFALLLTDFFQANLKKNYKAIAALVISLAIRQRKMKSDHHAPMPANANEGNGLYRKKFVSRRRRHRSILA